MHNFGVIRLHILIPHLCDLPASLPECLQSVLHSLDNSVQGKRLATCRSYKFKNTSVSCRISSKYSARKRIDASAVFDGNSSGGGLETYSSSDRGKNVQLRVEAVRLSRLHVDASNGGGVSGGFGEASDSAPASPTSFGGVRRLSRLWVGARRQSLRDGGGAPPSPTTDTRDKVVVNCAQMYEMRAFHDCEQAGCTWCCTWCQPKK